MKNPNFPSLYQINTKVWLTELSEHLARQATPGDISDNTLDTFGILTILLACTFRKGDFL